MKSVFSESRTKIKLKKANYKIDSIGWEIEEEEDEIPSVTIYALIVDCNNPDFQFPLQLSLKEVVYATSNQHVMIEDIGKMFESKDEEGVDEIDIFDELRASFNVKQLARIAFEILFDFEKEAEKASPMTSEELAEFKKIVRPLKKHKPVIKRNTEIFNELNDYILQALPDLIVKKYPVLNSSKDNMNELQSIIRIADFDYTGRIAELIHKVEKEQRKQKKAL